VRPKSTPSNFEPFEATGTDGQSQEEILEPELGLLGGAATACSRWWLFSCFVEPGLVCLIG